MWDAGIFNKHIFNYITLKQINMYSDPSTIFNPPSPIQRATFLASEITELSKCVSKCQMNNRFS